MGRKLEEIIVEKVGSEKVPVCASMKDLVSDVHDLMARTEQNYLPVFNDQGILCAVLSREDVSEALLEERNYQLNQLETYITGNPCQSTNTMIRI